jgi:hypothetical protein
LADLRLERRAPIIVDCDRDNLGAGYEEWVEAKSARIGSSKYASTLLGTRASLLLLDCTDKALDLDSATTNQGPDTAGFYRHSSQNWEGDGRG